MDKVYAVILVGGKGKRLKPLSTDARPKAFLSVTSDRKTMFARTVARAKRLVPEGNIIIVANKKHSRLVKRDFPHLSGENLVLEPVSRNTAPAIMLVTAIIKKREPDAVIVVLPVDQYIQDEARYAASIRRGIIFAGNNKDALITLGARPTYPATALGYIKLHGPSSIAHGIVKVDRFVEKPDLATAERYFKSGIYLWNMGAFIFKADAFLNAAKKFAPKIFNPLKDSVKAGGSYKSLPDISVDYAVMEKSDDIYCVKGRFGWEDMGNFENLKDVLDRESRRYVMKNGRITAIL